MQYWLLKSEPDVCSIDQQKKTSAKAAMEKAGILVGNFFHFLEK